MLLHCSALTVFKINTHKKTGGRNLKANQDSLEKQEEEMGTGFLWDSLERAMGTRHREATRVSRFLSEVNKHQKCFNSLCNKYAHVKVCEEYISSCNP